jgi:hypothetical protein
MKVKIVLTLFVVLFLVSCMGTVSINTEELTPTQKIAYTKATITGTNTGVASLLRSGAINLITAKEYRSKAREAQSLLLVYSTAVSSGDTTTAEAQWLLINNLLIQLNQYLMEANK